MSTCVVLRMLATFRCDSPSDQARSRDEKERMAPFQSDDRISLSEYAILFINYSLASRTRASNLPDGVEQISQPN